MKNIFTNLGSPAIVGSILVLPLIILELANRQSFHEGFPVALFVLLWVLPVAFSLILMPIVQNVRTGNRIMVNPFNAMFRVTLLILIAWIWISIIFDQMSCFLGVPNCD